MKIFCWPIIRNNAIKSFYYGTKVELLSIDLIRRFFSLKNKPNQIRLKKTIYNKSISIF